MMIIKLRDAIDWNADEDCEDCGGSGFLPPFYGRTELCGCITIEIDDQMILEHIPLDK